ncbi:LysR family transcriptional regulator [Frankia sp. CNm7]|uniref:LysR family transcriptional regulator n=1 Tax=Frankia nepalensis TaxID=1836974 RepID=A0A937RV80_9ACTN|nr:LysR family transcriptional regulator [Frankia nepalensis]MBL7501990.1 LysR family transcriptional regulator [Frankia nepalensis]MBL7510620.1 LysR family transcriptional regulator [Frankia nepalensis]MBL7517360.1 LysR family transcriptional regulator [Frankia nepalensis]MBL7633443.1 LysR family transcriptional regulator [Frankia nepalensis]
MRLRQLEYFLAICEHGSLTAASAHLLVAQPSLSRQIRALEKEVGAELLERGRQGVSLTAAGRVFLPHVRAVIQATEEARRSVANVVSGGDGELHVLTVRSVASGVLPAAVVRWHDKYPATVQRLHDFSHRKDLEAAMREGRGDLAIGPRPLGWEGEVVSIGFEDLVVAGRGPFAHAVASVEELRDAKWVHFEPEQGMTEVLDWASVSLGFTPRVVARVGQVAAALRLAIEGVGLAIVPANAVPHGWSHHVRPSDPPLFRELVAYSRGPMVQLTARFVSLLRAVELPLVQAQGLPADALVR